MTEKNTNWFVRFLVIVLCLFLVGLIGYRFFLLTPHGDLSAGVLAILALLVVLVLSESFDNFSIGKLLSLSREVEGKQKEISELKQLNLKLLGQIVSVVSSVSQHQNSTTALTQNFKITPASEDEIREKQAAAESQPGPTQPSAKPIHRVDRRRLEDMAITKFLEVNNLKQFSVERDIKLMTQIAMADPISLAAPVFDGYLNTLDTEMFIEIIRWGGRFGPIMFRERLYLMLSKLYHYRVLKNSNVYLFLLLVTLPEDTSGDSISRNSAMRLNEFQPAITQGLLKVVNIDITEAEASDLFVNS